MTRGPSASVTAGRPLRLAQPCVWLTQTLLLLCAWSSFQIWVFKLGCKRACLYGISWNIPNLYIFWSTSIICLFRKATRAQRFDIFWESEASCIYGTPTAVLRSYHGVHPQEYLSSPILSSLSAHQLAVRPAVQISVQPVLCSEWRSRSLASPLPVFLVRALLTQLPPLLW